MSDFDYMSIVNESVDAWPEPPTLPAGFWDFNSKGASRKEGRVVFALQPTNALEGTVVDPSIADKLNEMTVFASFNLARADDMTRVKALIRAAGLGTETLDGALKAFRNIPMRGEVTHTPKDDGTSGVYVNVRKLGVAN